MFCNIVLRRALVEGHLTVKTKTSMDYDHMGRVTAIRKTLNDSAATTRTILINTYDELGQLKNKKIGQKRNSDGSFSSTPLENQDYAYNIRGWLKGVNWNYTGSGGTTPYSPQGVPSHQKIGSSLQMSPIGDSAVTHKT